MKRDDKGLSLIEVIVTVSVIAILAAILTRYTALGARFFRQTSGTSQAQMNIQELADTLENEILNADWRVYYDAEGGDGAQAGTKTLLLGREDEESSTVGGTVTGTKTTRTVDVLVWSASEQKISYVRKTQASTTTEGGVTSVSEWTEAGEAQTLSSGVEDFQADLSGVKTDGVLRFQLTMEVNGESVSLLRTVDLRNQPTVENPF